MAVLLLPDIVRCLGYALTRISVVYIWHAALFIEANEIMNHQLAHRHCMREHSRTMSAADDARYVPNCSILALNRLHTRTRVHCFPGIIVRVETHCGSHQLCS